MLHLRELHAIAELPDLLAQKTDANVAPLAVHMDVADQLPLFYRMMEIVTDDEINQLCEQRPGLYRFAKMPERVAEAGANIKFAGCVADVGISLINIRPGDSSKNSYGVRGSPTGKTVRPNWLLSTSPIAGCLLPPCSTSFNIDEDRFRWVWDADDFLDSQEMKNVY